MFPRLFIIAVNKESFVNDCSEVRNGCTVWGAPFRRSLRTLEGGSYEGLMSILTNVFICKDPKNSQIWKPSIFGELSAKAFFLALEG